MITVDTVKNQQLEKGYYSIGTGSEVVLLIGSCRVMPYATYLNYLNGNNRFTINVINIVQFSFDLNNNRTDFEAVISKLETNDQFIGMIKSVKYFIHEPVVAYGMFNNVPMTKKNIYQFGMDAEFDISLPSYDLFILFQDIVSFIPDMTQEAKKDFNEYGKLSMVLQEKIKQYGLESIQNLCRICMCSSFPEFSNIFSETWKKIRYYWTTNHISNQFTCAIFKLMNDKFLHIGTPQAFWSKAYAEDMFFGHKTNLTSLDIDHHGIEWDFPVHPLSI